MNHPCIHEKLIFLFSLKILFGNKIIYLCKNFRTYSIVFSINLISVYMKCIHITIQKTGKHTLSRFTIMQNAYKYKVTGYVVRESGDMFIEAQGEEENLEKFIEWCHMSQPWTPKETKYVTLEEGTLRDFNSFEIFVDRMD